MKSAILQAIYDWNPWQVDGFPQELQGLARDYHLLDYLEIPEIKIMEGARRVGKSTLFYQVIHHVLAKSKNILYLNFSDEILKKHSLADIVYAYLEQRSIDYLFVDEIQNCSEWVSFIRKAYDRREIKQIWVSGSNSSLIKKEYASLLTGRNIAIYIQPLSFHEFLRFKSMPIKALPVSKKEQVQINMLFLEYMEYGAFPAIVTRNVLKKELLLAYFEDFIYKDIGSRYQVNATKVKELAIYLATNSSKKFSYRSIAVALSCHVNTVVDYFDYLKEIFLFAELYKFDFSLKKQYANEKKVYCLDSGLAAAVSFRFSEDKGRILENIVFNELHRRNQEIYFNKQKFECDFIIKKELQIMAAIQVCYSLQDPKTKDREMNGLVEALQTYSLSEGLILTYEEEGEEEIVREGKAYRVKIEPIWRWLLTK